jgi:spore coat protein U-like protein
MQERRAMSIRRTIVAAILFAILVAMPSASEAACTISTTSVAFGTYNVFNVAPVNSTGSVTYRCGFFEWLFVTITITLDPGQSGTYAARTMRKGAESLAYNLYRDTTFSQVWGNLSQGTTIYSARPPLATNVNVPVYGRVPPGQDVSAGLYTDTVIATINF